MSVVAALLELQEVDDQIRCLEKELKDLPRKKALEMARLSGVSADLTAAKESLNYVLDRVKGFESEAASLKEKVSQLKQTQMGLKTNKEYQQYSVQIDFVNHDIEAAESNQLAAMDDIPSAEKRVADVQSRYDQEKEGCEPSELRLCLVLGQGEGLWCRAFHELASRSRGDIYSIVLR